MGRKAATKEITVKIPEIPPGHKYDIAHGKVVREGHRWDPKKNKEVPETRGRVASPMSRREQIPLVISRLEKAELEDLSESLEIPRSQIIYSFFREGMTRLRRGRAEVPKVAPAMPVVFVAGPFTAETQFERERNTQAAAAVAVELWRAGAVVICPHLNSGIFFGAAPEEIFYSGYLELVRRSNGIFMLKGWEESKHAVEEKIEAENAGVRVFTTMGKILAWLQSGAEPS